VSVRYDRNGSAQTVAVKNVTFDVSEGDTLIILGPNGSGKSTLVQAIAGATDATVSGEIQVLGRSVRDEARHRRARMMAMVHQDPGRGTAAHLTLREHCDLTAATTGRRRVSWDQVASRLQALGTTLNAGHLAGELSGGQRQLFTVLLAVLSAPRILLLDEPTSALDGRHAALVLDVVREFSGPETATIMVTHDLAEACEMGNGLLVLNAKGEVQTLLDRAAKAVLDEHSLRDLLTAASATAWTRRPANSRLKEETWNSGSDQHGR